MKKRCTCICLALMMIVALCALPVGASESVLPTIEQQPQNLVYPVGSVAIYSIEVSGKVDSCTWFLEYGDETYDLSKANGSQPWEAFVTGGCGSNKDGNTYLYFFEGIEEGLAGSHIYAVVKQGTYELTSQKVMIHLGGSAMPPSIHVPVEVEIELGGELGLLCVAKAPNGGLLSYTWYETSTGKIHDIVAIERGEAKDPTLYVDTSEAGVRYYVCMVETEQEGVGYSSVIPVYVLENSAMTIPVLFTKDSKAEVESSMTVDLEAMADSDSGIYEAFIERTAQYQWYKDGAAIAGATQATYTFQEKDAGHTFFVEVVCGDLHLRSDEISIPGGAGDPPTNTPEGTEPKATQDRTTPETEGGFPWWLIPIVLGAMAVGAVIAYAVTKKTMKK